MPSELVEPVVQLFGRYGVNPPVVEEPGGFNPDDDEKPSSGEAQVRTYLPVNRRLNWRRTRIEVGVRLLSLVHPIAPMESRTVEPRDWEEGWKAFYTLLRVGRRLMVCPSWTEYEAKEGEVVVRLDPGMAFGTGHHPTTRLCLAELERRMRPGARVLDLGTGSGILAIAAAGLGADGVVGLDRDATACTVARRNVRANGLARRVRVTRGSIPRPGASGFDIVLANISAKVLTELASPLAQTLAPDGVLIASGVLEEQGASVAEAFRGAGLHVHEVQAMEDWAVIVASLAP